jgi:two-component sensor histidine kinase
MATVHEKLYKSEGDFEIALEEYLKDLLQGIVRSQRDVAGDVTF